MKFSGVDIIAEHHVGEPELRRVLSACLAVPVERVVVIDEVAHYPERAKADIVCIRSSVEGQFRELLSIQADQIQLSCFQLRDVVQAIADRVGMRCLTPDDSPDPFLMWLVAPGVPAQRIALDPLALDEGRYIIERQM